ncbi:hypothetical protein DUI87_10831 [Hirundo rustica rustica]|uniref:Uncharacterized protein n=1 Tax=Hirundo rustica rustica TaxID=333673 RepID=A0A3M0KJR2_HIRRU|nr:hypothetical protein DUI87_10831 [Hirundo rustica rustica]
MRAAEQHELPSAGASQTPRFPGPGLKMKRKSYCLITTAVTSIKCYLKVNGLHMLKTLELLTDHCKKYMSCCSLEKHETTEQPLSPNLSWAGINEGGAQDLGLLTDPPFTILWFPSSDLAPILLYVSHSMLGGNFGSGVDVVDYVTEPTHRIPNP